MGISTLVTLAADAVSLSWSAATYLLWYFLSGQSHKALMNGRKKSIGTQEGEHCRRAEEHDELITHFKGYKTIVEALIGTSQEFPSSRALGTRELLKEEDEKQPN